MIFVWLLDHLLSCYLALQVFMDRMQQRDGGRIKFYHAMFGILVLYQGALIGMLVSPADEEFQNMMVYVWGLVSLTGMMLLPGVAAQFQPWSHRMVVIRFGVGLLTTGLFMMMVVANWYSYAPFMGLIMIVFIAIEYNSLQNRLNPKFHSSLK